MYLKDLGEDRIIKELARKFSSRHPRLIKAIGDDTSVTIQKGGLALLATTDILIEGTHFKRSYTPAYFLGKKALAISISDIAAMGGDPLFFLVSIGLPDDARKDFLDNLYKGIADCASECGAVLAGGNTARLAGRAMVSTTVFGEMPKNEVVYRSGARPGDIIYVTGTPGDSALGLKVLGRDGFKKATDGPYKKAALKHLSPTPRVRAGRLLAKARLATSMIDVSDGVALDLKRVLDESGAGAVIEIKRLPLSDELRKYLHASRKAKAADFALSGGEDYELLFTSPEKNSKKIGAVQKRLGIQITPIGRIVEKGKGLRIIGENNKPMKLARLGFEHF